MLDRHPLPSAQEVLTACLRRALPSARAEPTPLPDIPELQLYLLNVDFSNAELTPKEAAAVLRYPAYWAFCWASGQVLARHLLDHPERVDGRCVLDFGCGSGVAAIAAAKAGARRVIACDLDPDALLATEHNAALNGVELELASDFDAVAGDVDLILAADVLYDRDNLVWLPRFLARASTALVADSRIRDFSAPRYRRLATHTSGTWPDLDEFDEFRRVSVYVGSR